MKTVDLEIIDIAQAAPAPAACCAFERCSQPVKAGAWCSEHERMRRALEAIRQVADLTQPRR